MNLTKTLKFLLMTTSLLSTSLPVEAMDGGGEEKQSNASGASYILFKTPIIQTVAPSKSLGSTIISELPGHLRQEAWKEWANFSETGLKLYKEGWESLIGDTLEAFINSINSRYLTKHLSPSKKTSQEGVDKLDEFSEEALRPLVSEIRQRMASLIQRYCMRGGFVSYDSKTDQKIQSYLDESVYRFLAQKFIPDFIPFKKVFIALTDFQPIKYYLDYQIDMMIVKSILSLYQKTTGKTFKRSAEDLVRCVTGRTSASQHALQDTTQQDHSFADQGPSLSGQSLSEWPEEDTQGELSALPTQLTPKVVDQKEVGKAKTAIEHHEEQEKSHFSSIHHQKHLYDYDLSQAETSYSQLWAYFMPHFQNFIRLAFNDVLKPISETVLNETSQTVLRGFLENKFVTKNVKIVGGGFGVGAGLVATYVTGGQSLFLLIPLTYASSYLGASCLGWVAAKSSKFAFDHTTTRLKNNLSALIDSYSYHLIPLTREEHVLYHLNPIPTQEEKLFYAADYQLREQLAQKTLLGELIRDVIKASRGVSQYLLELPLRLSQYVFHFLQYSQISTESTQTILTMLDCQEGTKQAFLKGQKKGNVSGAALIARIAYKKEHNLSLTPHEALVWDNVLRYPSFEIHQQTNQLIDLWQKDRKTEGQTLARALKQLAHRAATDQQELLGRYDHYNDLPSEFALLYQQLQGAYPLDERFDLDFMEVEEILAENILGYLDAFTPHELKLFDQAMKNTAFLSNYLEDFIFNYSVVGEKHNDSHICSRDILKDPDLFKGLPSAYVRQMQQAYIKAHEQELNELQESLLAEGLSFADTVNLHQHMTDEQRAYYIKRKPQELTDEILQPELNLIQGIISHITRVNFPNIVQFYGGAFTKQYDLAQFAARELRELSQTSPYDERYGKQQEMLEADKAKLLSNRLKKKLEQDPVYQSFRIQLREVLPDNAKLRAGIHQHITYQMMQEIFKSWGMDPSEQEGWTFIETPQDSEQHKDLNQTTSSLQDSLPLDGSLMHSSTNETILMLQEDEREIPLHTSKAPFNLKRYTLNTSDQTDFTAYQLCNLVNRLSGEGKIRDITHLSFDDLKTIHREIQEQKLLLGQTLHFEALDFAKNNLAAIIDFKNQIITKAHFDSTSKETKYTRSLFYSYEEIYDLIRQMNDQVIEQIKMQPNRAL